MPQDSGPFKILLVDDEPAARFLLTRILGQRDYTFTEAGDGIQALDFLGKSGFDLIITDFRMPNLDGLELAVRARTRWPDIPIVLMSGYFSQTAWKLFSELFAGFIQKPINRRTLIQMIHKNLMPHRSSTEQ